MPQPIDLQTQLTQVTAAERIQQVAARQAQALQQRSAAQQQQQQVEAETQVRETTEAEHGKVDADNDAHAQKRRKGKKKPLTPEDIKAHTFYSADEKPEVIEDPEAHRLDISI